MASKPLLLPRLVSRAGKDRDDMGAAEAVLQVCVVDEVARACRLSKRWKAGWYEPEEASAIHVCAFHTWLCGNSLPSNSRRGGEIDGTRRPQHSQSSLRRSCGRLVPMAKDAEGSRIPLPEEVRHVSTSFARKELAGSTTAIAMARVNL
eukprot:scaffold47_cov258-Pinguiococcus_pyrenoidosus.AAC.56